MLLAREQTLSTFLMSSTACKGADLRILLMYGSEQIVKSCPVNDATRVLLCSHAVDRRKRFILSFAGSIGLGISLKPTVFTENLWNVSPTAPTGVRMLQESVSYSPPNTLLHG